MVNILGKRLPFQAGFESLLVESRLRWEARNRVQTQRPTCGYSSVNSLGRGWRSVPFADIHVHYAAFRPLTSRHLPPAALLSRQGRGGGRRCGLEVGVEVGGGRVLRSGPRGGAGRLPAPVPRGGCSASALLVCVCLL